MCEAALVCHRVSSYMYAREVADLDDDGRRSASGDCVGERERERETITAAAADTRAAGASDMHTRKAGDKWQSVCEETNSKRQKVCVIPFP